MKIVKKDLEAWHKLIRAVMVILTLTIPVYAWDNGVGSPSTDQNDPIIGTHDLMLNDAINMLPVNLQSEINIIAADYGSEMPDYNSTVCNCIYGVGDQKYHLVYYHRNGTLQDNSSARRAQEEYNIARTYLNAGDKYNFSIHIGMMSHYIADVSNFAHTMGNGSDWGNEGHVVHGNYENFVANAPDKLFNSTSIKFDGIYDSITAYNATLNSANDTIFDNKFGNGTYNVMWMYDIVKSSINLSYASADIRLVARTRQSLNYNVNLIADVLYTMLSSNGDILSYYRGLGIYPNIVETNGLLKAADDWRNDAIPPGFSTSVATAQLLTLADEWRNS
jgi:hypothetical protein